jgi:hypothetical protein
MANRAEEALWGLFERARVLRRNAFNLSRQLGKTCDEIKARETEQTKSLPPEQPGPPAKTQKPR